MFKNFIQVAGVIDKEEAGMLIECGIKFLGFPLRLPVNKEDLTDEEASEIISGFPQSVKGILITYLNNADVIKSLSNRLGIKVIQLHGEIDVNELIKLKEIFPESVIIKSLIVGKTTNNELLESIRVLENHVDTFITDTYNPATGATGATGITHDWEISRTIVEKSSKPVVLAGGLTPENVYEAILTVKPAGIDTHTGVENHLGRKERAKVIKFVEEARRGFNKIEKNQNDL